MEIADIIKLTESIFTILAIIIGGTWTYLKFIRQRENYPKILFELDIKFIGKVNGKWLVELQAMIENKGLVQHEISGKSFTFDLSYLTAEDAIENKMMTTTQNSTHQLLFSRKMELNEKGKKNTWLPDNYTFTFIEPGIVQRYSHIIAIPEEVKVLFLYSMFEYRKSNGDTFHDAEKVVLVPEA